MKIEKWEATPEVDRMHFNDQILVWDYPGGLDSLEERKERFKVKLVEAWDVEIGRRAQNVDKRGSLKSLFDQTPFSPLSQRVAIKIAYPYGIG